MSESVWGDSVKHVLKRSSGQAGYHILIPEMALLDGTTKRLKLTQQETLLSMSTYSFPEWLVCSGTKCSRNPE